MLEILPAEFFQAYFSDPKAKNFSVNCESREWRENVPGRMRAQRTGKQRNHAKRPDDALLSEDEDSLPTQTAVPAASEKPSDTLESTLNDNMLSVTKSMNSMQEAIVRLADSQRPSKRQRVDELYDSDTDSNNEASASLDEDSDTLLENVAKTRPTREPKDDLLDAIANDLNADE